MISERVREALYAWQALCQAERRFKDLGYCRSNRPPDCDFSEWLVAELLDGSLCDSLTCPDYDVVRLEDGLRIQVKKIRRGETNQNYWPPGSGPNGSLPTEANPSRPTHYAYVEFDAHGVPIAVYLCKYEWVAENTKPGGLSPKRVREASKRADGDRAVIAIPLPKRAALAETFDASPRSMLTLRLPDDVQEALARIARQERRRPEEVAEDWLAAAIRTVEGDPLIKLLGTVTSEVSDAAERHDEYIGQELHAALHRSDG
jgi:hypothetical protein